MDVIRLIHFFDVEPIIFLYMLSSYLKMPVFFSLLYTKSCYFRYNFDYAYCSNNSATHSDVRLQTDANHLFLLSSVCLTLPSILTSLFIGDISDRYSRKMAICVPQIGLLANDINYLVQTTFMHLSPYYLLISDLLFALLGGYTSILGTTFSYAADRAGVTRRSYKMALLESSIGLGGTIGFVLSGYVLFYSSFRIVFLIQTLLHCTTALYSLLVLPDLTPESHDKQSWWHRKRRFCLCAVLVDQVKDFFATVFKRRPQRSVILTVLLAFMVSFIVFSGSDNIMFYYLQRQLKWTSVKYGQFRGVYFGTSTLMIMLVYPLLKRVVHLKDTVLALIGITSRGVGCLLFAFVFSDLFVFLTPLVIMFNRFAAAAMRSIISQQVDIDEQGKIFSAVGVLEGVCGLIASSFNAIYPATLSIFPGLSYAVMAALMLISFACILFVHFKLKSMTSEVPGIEDRTTPMQASPVYAQETASLNGQ